jgi:imidazole glycerol-phosphate synthase subunit HisF
MFRPRVIPTLLLSNSGLVKTTRFQSPSYIGDPMNAVKIFNDLEADEILLLDIDATKDRRTIDFNLVKNIGDESYVPFSVGGGITSVDQIGTIIRSGSEKVVIGTAAITNPELISNASELYGSQSIVVCVDILKSDTGQYHVMYKNGKIPCGLPLVDFIQKKEYDGAGELIIQSIDRDGTQKGYDIELLKLTSSSVSIPIIALGGAGKLTDFYEAVISGRASAASAGSKFVYMGGKNAVLINYPDHQDLLDMFAV